MQKVKKSDLFSDMTYRYRYYRPHKSMVRVMKLSAVRLSGFVTGASRRAMLEWRLADSAAAAMQSRNS